MQIDNNLTSVELAIAALVDPVQIDLYKTQVADQMNAQAGIRGGFADLSDRIADIVIETSAQGASILEVSVIDPTWGLLISGFISVDDAGLLYPPIELNFPKDRSDAIWRLVACRPTSDLSGANLILTFEDRIASVLRDVDAQSGGVQQSAQGQTLGGFIQDLVKAANKVQGVSIRLVELLSPSDPNYAAPISKPASFNLAPSNGGGRGNPNKNPGGITPAQQGQLDVYHTAVSQLIGISPGGLQGPTGGPLTLNEIELGVYQMFGRASYQNTPGLPPMVP